MPKKKPEEAKDEGVISERKKAGAKDRYQIALAFRYKGEGYEPGDKVPEMEAATLRSLIYMGRVSDNKKPEAGDEATTSQE